MKKINPFPYLATFYMAIIIQIIGCGSESTEPTQDVTPPQIPTGLSLSGTDGEVMLNWSTNIESDLAGYLVYRAENADANYQMIDSVLKTSTSFLDVGLDYDTPYYYRVSAYDNSGNESEKSEPDNITPFNQNNPDRPQGLTVRGHNILFDGLQLDIQLNWIPNIESDLAGYSVYKDTVSNFPNDLTHLVASVSSAVYVDTDVEVGKLYYYAVRAIDKGIKESNPTNGSDIPLPQIIQISPDSAVTTNSTPTFVWYSVDAPSSVNVQYKLFVTTSRIGGDAIPPTVVSDTTFSIDPGSSLSSGPLYWRVGTISNDSNDINSNSPTWEFFVQ